MSDFVSEFAESKQLSLPESGFFRYLHLNGEDESVTLIDGQSDTVFSSFYVESHNLENRKR